MKLIFALTDGSRIIGTPAIDRLKITAGYAALDVQLSSIYMIEFKGADRIAKITLQNGDIVSGALQAAEIAIKTGFGQVVVPLDNVERLLVSSTAANRGLPGGLVLHYVFAMDEGDKVTDASASGYDGTVVGATHVSDENGVGAMSFSGDRQAVIAKSPAKLQLQDFTIMAWVKRGSAEKISSSWDSGVIFAWGHAGYGLAIYNDGRPFLSRIMVPGSDVFAPCKIQDEKFHHLVLTKKGTAVVFYLDGTAYPAAELMANYEFGSEAVAVGAMPDDNQEGSFLGLIREVAVFDRALSGEEVKRVYDLQK